MTDPLDRLRETGADTSTPDISAIKSRARRIVRRRHVGLSAGAAMIAVIATVGVLTGTRPEAEETLARSDASRTPLRAGEPVTETSGAVGATAGTITEGRTGAPSGAAPLEEQTEQRSDRTSGVSGGTAAARGTPPTPFVATLHVSEASLGRGRSFTLEVCNAAEVEAGQSFATAQRYDFVVERDDEEVWRWSEGRAFAQETATERWRPKECHRWTEEWNGIRSSGPPAPPGEYRATGTLASSQRLEAPPRTFCLDVC